VAGFPDVVMPGQKTNGIQPKEKVQQRIQNAAGIVGGAKI
jgi:hypothetical protein